MPIAVIEAKQIRRKPGDGLQQAIDYAEHLELRLLERLPLVDQIEATMARRASLRDALLPAARNEELSRLTSA